MNEQAYLQHSLRKAFEDLKAKNSRFGIRAFAKRLDISPSALSEFLNGKRQFSRQMAERIMEKLSVDPKDIHEVLKRFPLKRKEVAKRMELNQRDLQLRSDQYQVVADSIFYSLLCLMETDDFTEDFGWMATRLNSTSSKVKTAFQTLERLGLIGRDELGRLRPIDKRLNTSDDIANLSLRKRHEENAECAKEAIRKVDIDKRYFVFETLAVDPVKLEQAKAIMRKAREEIILLMDEGNKSEVYEFCFHGFPKSNLENFYEN